MFRFTKTIPAGRKALVAGFLSRKEREVVGPRTVPAWASVRFFEHRVISDGDVVSVVDAGGKRKEVTGPAVVHAEPDGAIEMHARYLLAANEVLVIIAENGVRRFIFGKKPEGFEGAEEKPVVWVKPTERVHKFVLTGGGNEDGLGKEPGKLKFSQLRISPTQCYFAVPVRTKTDHTPLILKLMIFFKIADLRKFVESTDDPYGVMFNEIMVKLVGKVSAMTFDEFKKDPCAVVESGLSAENLKSLEANGLKIEKVTLRGWVPENNDIQRVLNEAALTNTKREIQAAQHAARLEALGQERVELEKAKGNDALRADQATAEGTRRGQALQALVSALGMKDAGDPSALLQSLAALEVAGNAVSKNGGSLAIPQSLLEVRVRKE